MKTMETIRLNLATRPLRNRRFYRTAFAVSVLILAGLATLAVFLSVKYGLAHKRAKAEVVRLEDGIAQAGAATRAFRAKAEAAAKAETGDGRPRQRRHHRGRASPGPASCPSSRARSRNRAMSRPWPRVSSARSAVDLRIKVVSRSLDDLLALVDRLTEPEVHEDPGGRRDRPTSGGRSSRRSHSAMKELIRLLNEMERRTIVVLAAASGLALLALIFVAGAEVRSFRRADASARTRAAELVEAGSRAGRGGRRSAAVGRKRGGTSRSSGRKGSTTSRARSGTSASTSNASSTRPGSASPRSHTSTATWPRGRCRKVVAGFTFGGTYVGLKRFLSVVERSPKFLTLERIDFPFTGTETAILQLKIELAAYYAM